MLRISVITSDSQPVLKLRWVGEEVPREDITLEFKSVLKAKMQVDSEALIQQLAKAKLLEPATGRPTPASPAAVKPRFLPPDIITVNEQNIEWRLLG